MRVVGDEEDEDDGEDAWDQDGDDEVDGFELTSTEGPQDAPRQRAASGRKKAAR